MGGVSCRTCGLVNPPGRTFCQRCGQRLDPAVGTVAGAPRPVARTSSGGGGRGLALVGVGLIVVAAVAGAALVFGGILGGPSPTATARTALRSAAPARPGGDVTAAPPAGPADGTTHASAHSRSHDRARHRADRGTDRWPATHGGWSDGRAGGHLRVPPERGAIQDPLSEGWRIQGVNWSDTGASDRVVVTLNRAPPMAGNATQAIVHLLPVNEVADTLKVVAPSMGRNAVALGLWQGVRLTWALDRELSLPKVRWVTMGKDDNGFAWLVLGVRGEACYSIDVPAWSSGEPGDDRSIEVMLDVQH